MLTEVTRYYGLARPPIDAGFFETEHHAQVSRDIRAAIMGGRLIALTAVIGSGKTILLRRLRAELEREGRVIVSQARCRSTRRRSPWRCCSRRCSTT
jgi:type II secretory pathway predicted ATPase ExeA